MVKIILSAQGRKLLDDHVISLRDNTQYPVYPRALLEAMLDKAQPQYLEDNVLRNSPSEAELLRGDWSTVYVFDSEVLRMQLAGAELNTGRNAAPAGEPIDFSQSFSDVWQQLLTAVAGHEIVLPAQA